MGARAFPEHAGGARGALNEVVLGPSGLLEMLSVHLGLTAAPVPRVVRVATWLAKLDAASAVASCFWSLSMRADPWSVAEETLAWRDGLVEGGWNGDSLATPRIADLARARRSGPTLPAGQADRLRAVIDAVRAGGRTGLVRLDLLDGTAALPPGWRDLTSALATAGTHVVTLPLRTPRHSNTDLCRLQHALRAGAPSDLAGDGTVAVLEADTTVAAAEAAAEWLAAAVPERPTVLIAGGRDGFLLDRALARRAMPSHGLSAASPFRGPLQVLAARLATLWLPLDVEAMLRLLQLPCSPLPPWVGRRLAVALSREPGFGQAWAGAWDGIVESAKRDHGARSPHEAGRLVEEWRSWTEAARYPRPDGMPVREAIALCRKVEAWARNVGGRDGLHAHAAAACADAAQALSASGRSHMPAALLERLVAAAAGGGARAPGAVAEASLTTAVKGPGAVWNRTDDLLWFDAGARSGGLPAAPWTAVERTALERSGCRLPHPRLTGLRAERDRRRAVANVGGRLVLVFVRPRDGQAAHDAPGWLGRFARDVKASSMSIEDVLGRDVTMVAGRSIKRRRLEAKPMPDPRSAWTVPAGLAVRLDRRPETATTLGDLVTCPMRWLLSRVAGVRPGGDLAAPSAGRLVGDLAHAVAAEAFEVGQVPDPARVAERAADAVRHLVDRVAAPLRRPDTAAAFAHVKRNLPASLAVLAGILAERGAAVVGLEVEREGRFGDVRLKGRLDMLVLDAAGRESVVDLKWTARPELRRTEVERGEAVQLAAYARLVTTDGSMRAGYYLLRQRSLVAEAGMPLATEGMPTARDLAGTWRWLAAEHAKARQAAATGGVLRATGVVDAGRWVSSSHVSNGRACMGCDFRTVCRVNGGASA